MSAITSSIGLITGIPIEDTVNQLMQIAARPRDLVASRNEGLQSRKLAVDGLNGLVLSLQSQVNKWKSSSIFNTTAVTSSKPASLTATIAAGGNPAVGNYVFTPVQTASNNQFVSNSFGGTANATSVGAFSFQRGGFVNQGINLSDLNSGQGVSRGQIRITDRSGDSAIIDLRFAKTVDDVLEAINKQTEIEVTASVVNDQFVLTDTTGQSSSNLKVEEINNGETATDLGLVGINVAADSATGNDVFTLHNNTKLSTLNDGNGVELTSGNDLKITFGDGSTLDVDLGNITKLGEVVSKLNSVSPSKISANIRSDGKGIEVHDLTAGGGGNFSIISAEGKSAAEDLGLATEASGSTITGKQLAAGLKTSLLSRLNGGSGLGSLGELYLKDRSGAEDTIDLSAAETLDDVIRLINDSSASITAQINTSRNGIQLTDTSGGSANNLIIANADGTNSADALGIAIDAATTKVNSGPFHKQTVSKATLIASLNQGKGIQAGSIKIVDSDGVSGVIDLGSKSEIKTVGQLVDAINNLTVGVEASLNANGDGIQLVDTADGANTLHVTIVGNKTTAQDLGLLGSAKTVLGQQIIDGTRVHSVQIANSIGLSKLHSGVGISLGSFSILDSSGNAATINLNDIADDSTKVKAVTIGDVLDAINSQSDASVSARLNEAGDGILLIDTAGGAGALTVSEVDDGTTAADLGILGTASTLTVEGESVEGIHSAGLFDSSNVDSAALARVVEEINSLKVGITASTFFDGEGQRLSLTSDATGTKNAILIDSSQSGFKFSEVSTARDALLLFGSASNAAQGVLASSETNTFQGVVEGIDLKVIEGSTDPITVNVATSNNSLVSSITGFVSAYNAVRSNVDAHAKYDPDTNTTGLLFGTNELLRVDTELSGAVTRKFFGVGSLQSLEQIGISVDDKGKLSFDQSKLNAAFADDPESLKTFFTDETNGVATRFEQIIKQLSTNEFSLLNSKSNSLASRIETNTFRLENMNASLEKQRTRLFAQFQRMEEVIAKMQNDLQAVQGIQFIQPITRRS